MGNVLQENIATTKQMQTYVFEATNIGDANGDCYTAQAATLYYRMPWRGSIVAISVVQNAELTTGSLAFSPNIAGTIKTALTATVANGATSDDATVAGRTINFSAGALLGAEWVKTGTVDPTTTDVTVAVTVLFEDVDL